MIKYLKIFYKLTECASWQLAVKNILIYTKVIDKCTKGMTNSFVLMSIKMIFVGHTHF